MNTNIVFRLNRALAIMAIASVLVGCSSSSSTTSPSTSGSSQPTVTVSGIVQQGDSSPIASARVYIGGFASKGGESILTDTDAAGGFRGTIHPSERWQMLVRKPGFDPYRVEQISIVTDTQLTIVMRPGVQVIGGITDTAGNQLGGVTVTILSGVNAGVTATSDVGPGGVIGSYILHVLPDTFTIRASKQGYASIERAVDASPARLDLNSEVLFDMSLPPL